MAIRFFNRNIPDECHQKMRDFAAAGDDVICVAFAPGGPNRWSVIAKSGGYFNRNIPDECHQKMAELSAGPARVVRVAFPPAGGNSWSIVNAQGAFFNRNIPDECHQKMQELSQNGAKIVSVAFPPGGGNSWSVVNDKGAYFNRNIPDECHQAMQDLSKDGAKIISVAFPQQGGNSWSVVNDKGAYVNRNIADEAHMIMGYYSEVYGPVRHVAFDSDGNGWSVISAATLAEKVCDSTRCAPILDVYRNIQAKLDGKAVGYACTVGASSIGAFSYGSARTSANAPSRMFLPSTKIPTASVAKLITALAAVRILAKHNVSLDSTISGHLPSDWTLSTKASPITFRGLLSHRSGIKDYGNNDQSYATLKTFFTSSSSSINPADTSGYYSNYNFSIFRILLPMIDGFVNNDPANIAAKLAAAYVKIVQKGVFEPVGAMGVDTKPPTSGPQATGYAFSYGYPGTSSGFDWGDSTLGAGAAGWYLAIDDIARVLYSLNKNDGRIVTSAQLADMEATPLGWDVTKDGSGYRWVEKNGGWGMNGTTISTSIALFGPGVYGALFINSDVLGPNLQNNWRWCKKCQTLAFAGNASAGDCPAGGTHDTSQSMAYFVPHGGAVPAGNQSNWRWCNKCQALHFAGGSPGQCSGGGNHDHTGSGSYSLAFRGSGALPEYTQENWRWCRKCQVLSFNGSATPGPCAAGAQHDHTGSGNYVLGFQVGADTILHDSYMQALTPRP